MGAGLFAQILAHRPVGSLMPASADRRVIALALVAGGKNTTAYIGGIVFQKAYETGPFAFLIDGPNSLPTIESVEP